MSEELEIDPWNNFARVFEVPKEFPAGFCFGGGRPTNFQMVDWFNPFPGLDQPAVDKRTCLVKFGDFMTLLYTGDQVRESLIPFIAVKNYVTIGRSYLVICEFGFAFMFEATSELVLDLKNQIRLDLGGPGDV